ncbi:MAG: hypothetical protein EA391_06965 [Balneolaceae bacterium]|nr:MAG: hypothetical protein EA391_06965 [Balneolaceae bacterium]
MFRASKHFLAVAYPVSFLFILLSLLSPELNSVIAPWVVIVSVFLIGIPHGAIDHIMAAEIFNIELKFKDQLLFYGSYLLLMFILGAVWIFYPIAGMFIFLVISIYHFGQADMEEYLSENTSFSWFWHLIRGLYIILLIIFSDISVTYPILEQAMNISVGSLTPLISDPSLVIYSGLSIYLAITVLGITKGVFSNSRLYIADTITLLALFYFAGPLIGFALYFAIWHSAGHINEMREYFKAKNKSLSLFKFYKLSLPFTLISIFGLLILVYLQNAFGVQDMFFTLMFILISVLTLPHMLIVHKMYSD